MKFLKRSRFALIALLLLLCTLFSACNPATDPVAGTTPEGTTPAVIITTPESTTPSDSTGEGPASDAFDYNALPEYSGQLFVEVNNNTPYFGDEDYTTDSYEFYPDLDSLGRCGTVMACIGRDLMPTTGRGEIGHIHPSGWVQAYPNGTALYNRSHLIAHQLTGEDDNEKNLITGTAYFNQGGMTRFENMVADYIKETNNHVLYRVTPVFVGNELVARGVLMEAWSVEDDGDGICFNVFVYNVQPGVIIDYATGKSEILDAPDPGAGEAMDYIINKRNNKFHYPHCTGVAQMSEANKQPITATREEMIENGYSPCGTCKP